jgi:hypothetical protein
MTEDLETGAPSDARQTLLRALDHLDEIREEYGDPKNTYLIVAYAHQVDGQTVRGWACTDDPTFVTCALLREVADAIESGTGWDSDDEDDATSE